MRQRVLAALMTAAGLAGAMTVAAAAPAAAATMSASSRMAAASSGGWGKAALLPGADKLGQAGANGSAVSCPSTGNCTAGGSYYPTGGSQVYVISERNGRWGEAEEVPGLGALNTRGDGELAGISCASPGNCVAAGSYLGTGALGGYVAVQRNWRWGKAESIPGLSTLSVGGDAEAESLSCGSPGNCVAGGSYRDAAGHTQAFLATQKNGHWNKAAQARGTGALNVGGSAQVTAMSCPSAGNCAAGGVYAGTSDHLELFVISERNGSWGKATVLPGILSHNKGSSTQVYSLSCSSSGNCSAGGYYENAAFREFAFVITESGGRWGSVTEVPGLAGVSPGGDSGVNQLSCPSAGHCVGVGYGDTATHTGQAFYLRRT